MQVCTKTSSVNINHKLRNANLFLREKKWADALECYCDILEVFPSNRRAQEGLKIINEMLATPPVAELQEVSDLMRREDYQTALSLALSMLDNYPKSYLLWLAVGLIAPQLKQPELGEIALKNAITLNDDYIDSYLVLGEFYIAQQRHREAVAIASVLLDTKPNNSKALYLRGRAYNDMKMYHDAIRDMFTCLEHLDKVESDNALEMHIRRSIGVIYNELGDNDTAIRQLRLAQNLVPLDNAPIGIFLNLIADRCDWSLWEEFGAFTITKVAHDSLADPFCFLSYDDSPVRQRIRSQSYGQALESFRHKTISNYVPSKRLKIGYFTNDLHNHATLILLNGVIEKHNKEDFEIFLYGLDNPDMNSKSTQRFIRNVDHIRFLHEETDANAVDIVRRDQLDIAIDLKGYTKGCRPIIFAHGVAPVQINYLGYPGTMGIKAIDYIIADERVIPAEHLDGYSERVIYLPHSYQPNDRDRPISDEPVSRADYGLPEEAVVLCCFNGNYKITPHEYDVWMRILSKVDNAVLWLLATNHHARENLIIEAAKRGIGSERLYFAEKISPDRHLARHKLADLFLDTFNVNAHTTASDALWAGLPVVTKAGKQFAARVAASLLTAIGLDELITETVEEYESLIIRLATNPEELASVKARLAENRDTFPLFDTERYTRYLEEAYRQAVKAVGKPLQNIHIAAE